MEKNLNNIFALNELCASCKYNYYNTFNDHTALILAANTGHSHCVKVLIEAGADVNVRNTLGETALMYAARKADGDCVKILLKSGADVKIVNFNGDNAMTYAVGGSYDRCWRMREQFPTMTMEHLNPSVYASHKAGANGNTALQDGLALLMGVDLLTQIENHNASVYALVKAGADVNTCERDGTTLLMGAAQKGCELCVRFLVQAEADVNMCRTDGYSALIYAVTSNCHHCVRSLIEAGADVNVKCTNGDTPLIAASRNIDSAKTLKLLVDAGADVNVISNNGLGTTVLLMQFLVDFQSYAFDPTLLQQVKILLKAGARINVSGIGYNNALGMYVTRRSFPDKTMVLLLKAAGETSHRMADALSPIPSYFQEMDINLKQFCRDTIRKHLLDLNSQENLFHRVPRLGLPKILSQYLVYNVCIDDDESSLT